MQIKIFIVLLFIFNARSFAGVDFVKNPPLIEPHKALIPAKIQNIELVTYNGRFVGTLENNRYVTGSFFESGKPISVNGELVDDVLYLFDIQGKRYILILEKNR